MFGRRLLCVKLRFGRRRRVDDRLWFGRSDSSLLLFLAIIVEKRNTRRRYASRRRPAPLLNLATGARGACNTSHNGVEEEEPAPREEEVHRMTREGG